MDTTSTIPLAATTEQPASAPMLMGSELLIKSLEAENVKYIWGYPGGAAL